MATIIYYSILIISSNIKYVSTYILENGSQADPSFRSMNGPGTLFKMRDQYMLGKKWHYLKDSCGCDNIYSYRLNKNVPL